MASAKAQAYQDAADAPAMLRAYASDMKNYEAWCAKSGLTALPATPEVVGAYLAAAGEGYAMQTYSGGWRPSRGHWTWLAIPSALAMKRRQDRRGARVVRRSVQRSSRVEAASSPR